MSFYPQGNRLVLVDPKTVACRACGAKVGKPCTYTQAWPDHSVWCGKKMAGYHFVREGDADGTP